MEQYAFIISFFYENPKWIFIFSSIVIFASLTYSFRFRIVKLKLNKTMKTYNLRYFIYSFNLFLTIIILNILFFKPHIEIESKINNEISFYKKHEIVLNKPLKKCIFKTNILNKERVILKEECKTKDFKNLQNIEKNDIFSEAQYYNTSLIMLLISLLILTLSDKNLNNTEKFNNKKLVIFSLFFVLLSLFSNMNYFHTGIFSIIFIIITFFSNFEKAIGKNNTGLLVSILNHFKLIFRDYSFNNVIHKDFNFYFICNIDSIYTKIENLETGDQVEILTTSLFDYENTGLFIEEKSKDKKVLFEYSINKNDIEKEKKIFNYLEETIESIIDTKNFKIEQISYEDDIYKFIFIFENNEHKNLVEAFQL